MVCAVRQVYILCKFSYLESSHWSFCFLLHSCVGLQQLLCCSATFSFVIGQFGWEGSLVGWFKLVQVAQLISSGSYKTCLYLEYTKSFAKVTSGTILTEDVIRKLLI